MSRTLSFELGVSISHLSFYLSERESCYKHRNFLTGKENLVDMPVLRGININIISQESAQIHPEFLHPKPTQDSSPRRDLVIPGTEPHIDKVLGSKIDPQSLISVYVPSVPGMFT
jgi:hypothetical protein